MVQTYFPGDDFATIKNSRLNIFDENFWFKPISEETILQPLKIFDQKISMKIFGSDLFPKK